MGQITTHILDTSRGKPAVGVAVTLSQLGADGAGTELGRGQTDADGRLKTLVADGVTLAAGDYRLTFDVGSYFAKDNVASFYPTVSITFRIAGTGEHYHVPLLLNPYGYSTYRGT